MALARFPKKGFLSLSCLMTSHDWAKKGSFLNSRLPCGNPQVVNN